jgi:hypothetical protein
MKEWFETQTKSNPPESIEEFKAEKDVSNYTNSGKLSL